MGKVTISSEEYAKLVKGSPSGNQNKKKSKHKGQQPQTNQGDAYEKKLREEIKTLEEKRKTAGFFGKLGINKAINDRAKFLKQKNQLQMLKQQGEVLEAQKRIAKEKQELMEARKKGNLSAEDIFGTKDIFKF